jgi:L-ascorbate metabolism protein UlaG (beta-lactamase superfamily)
MNRFCIAMVPLTLTLVTVAGVRGRAASPPMPDGVTITFLANEGVLLAGTTAAGPRQVLIDALFTPHEGYPAPAESTSAALRAASGPFAGVAAVLVTHRHGDHFHPTPVAAHLAANRRALLVTSRQVVDSLRRGSAPIVLPETRIARRTQQPGSRRRMLVNDVPVELIGLPHSGSRRHRHVEHLAFVVELGGRRVLHLGDAELTGETLAPLRLDTMRIDVALVPWWALADDDTRRAVERWIRPARMAAFHLADENATRTRRELAESAPRAHVFSRRLESVVW